MKDLVTVSPKTRALKEDCKHEIMVPFRLQSVKGSDLVGTRCESCYSIAEWGKEGDESIENEFKPAEVVKDYSVKTFEAVVINLLAIKDKMDQMEFIFKHGKDMFGITVTSSPEKVSKALAKPTVIVGKTAIINYTQAGVNGIPLDGKVKSLKKN